MLQVGYNSQFRCPYFIVMNSTKSQVRFLRSTTEIVAGTVILVILMLGAFLGNLLTSLIFWRKPRLRTPTNISILFLSISDVLMASMVMPFSLVSLIEGKWPVSSEACTFNALLFHVLLGVTLTTMTCTAVIRYLCVVKRTLHHRYVKPNTVAIGIAILWLLNVIVQSFPVLLSSGHGIYNSKVGYCFYFLPDRDVGDTINYSGVTVAFILGLLIFLAYFKVFRFVSLHNHTVASNLQQGNPSQIEEAKITRTLVIVVLGFLACWAPVIIIQFIDILGRYRYGQFKMPTFVFLIQTMCIFGGSFINPFIYVFTNKRFRKEYFALLSSLLPSSTRIAPAEVL